LDAVIHYKEAGDSIFVRASGHITAALCPELKEKVLARLASAPPVAAIRIDLTPCDYMDSTFLGILVGFKKGLKPNPRASLSIHGANETCAQLLKTVGMTSLVVMEAGTEAFPPFMETLSGGAKANAEFLLDAHDNLSELSPENEKRFAILRSVLKQEIGGSGEK
jgi:anti-anti-sigma factor